MEELKIWKPYIVRSHNSNEIIEIGLEYSYREKSGFTRVYATYINNVLFIAIHSVQFSGEDLKLKIIQHTNFETANKTIEFVNKQYKINIPLITQKDLDAITNSNNCNSTCKYK